MTVRLRGHVFNGAGVAINGATVDVFTVATAADESTSSASATASTTTDSSGLWAVTALAENIYDVRITSGTEIRWLRYEDEIQVTTIETATLKIRNPADTFEYDILPAAISVDRTLTLPLLTGTARILATPSVEDLDMDGFDIDNAGFLTLNAATAPANTEVYLVHDNTGDLTLNALSGKDIIFAIAGTDEVIIDQRGIVLPAGSDLLFTGTTGTNDINLVDSVADALTIVRGSTDMMLFATDDPKITIATPLTVTGALVVLSITDSTSGTTGAVQTDGGLGVLLDLFVGNTLNVVGDTAVGDLAAIGHTTTEGLILTGQGSSTDVTIKNDADATVISIATGTTATTFAGTISAGAGTVTSLSVTDGNITNVGDIAADSITAEAANLSIEAVATNAIRLNDAQADVDVVWESDTFDNGLHLDATNGHIGIGTAASTTQNLHIAPPAETAPASGNFDRVLIQGANAVTFTSGAHARVSTLALTEPNITESGGTATGAFTLFIEDMATEGDVNLGLFMSGTTNMLMGPTAVAHSTAGTNVLSISEGTTPPSGAASNTASLFTDVVSTEEVLRGIGSGGTVTTL